MRDAGDGWAPAQFLVKKKDGDRPEIPSAALIEPPDRRKGVFSGKFKGSTPGSILIFSLPRMPPEVCYSFPPRRAEISGEWHFSASSAPSLSGPRLKGEY